MRLGLLGVCTLTVLLGACVDTTPPWEKSGKKDAGGGLAGAGGSGGTGGQTEDGAATGSGGTMGVEAGASVDGPGGPGVDASGLGGTLDSGAGGQAGIDGARADVPLGGSGGAQGGSGGSDVPISSGGVDGRTDGATQTGGQAGRDAGAGGAVSLDGAVDRAPDSPPDTTPDLGPDLGPDLAPNLGPDTGPDLGPDTTPDAPPDPLLTGLVAYYKCNETSGTTLTDSTTNQLHGTLQGSAGFAAGKLGNGLNLPKSGSSYVSLPTAVFSTLTDFTIAAWTYVATFTDWQRVFDTGINANQSAAPTTGTKYMNFTLRNHLGSTRWSISKDGIIGEESLNTASPPTGTWKHVTIVLTGGVGYLYIDGVQVNSDPTVLRPIDLGAIDYAYLGKSQFSVDPYFDGMLDEFRVYNRALSPSEVDALYRFAGP